MRKSLIVISAIVLCSCASTKVAYVPAEPVVDPCPVEGLANVQQSPKPPLQQPTETSTVYSAIARAVGNERAQIIIRYWESELPSWGKLGWNRVQVFQSWCANRNK